MSRDKTGECGAKAEKLFREGYNCAEAVLLALAEHLGFESAVFPKIATGFGGGMARNQLVCGALTGAIMGLGLKYGRFLAVDDREPTYQRVNRLLTEFQNKFQSLHCRDLAGFDFKNEAEMKLKGDKLHHETCPPYVRFAAELAAKLIQSE